MEAMLACMCRPAHTHAHSLFHSLPLEFSLSYTNVHIHLHKHKQSKCGPKPLITFSVSIWKAEVWFNFDFKTQAYAEFCGEDSRKL